MVRISEKNFFIGSQTMNIEKIRRDFPLLNPQNGRKPIIYLDNACQSLRPQAVIQAVQQYYEEYPACAGRSMHRLASEVSRQVDEARQQIAKFLHAGRKEEIVFTRNTTEAINLVANALTWKAGDVVLLSDKEHNSNLIPWQMLTKRYGVCLKFVPSNPDNTFNLSAYQQALQGGVRLVAMGYTSNLDGVSIPAEDVVRLAHKHGTQVLLDAAQTAPHQRLDVRRLDADWVAFSGHKMLAPSGIGILYGKYRLLEQMQPFLVGGDTVASSTYEDCQFLPPPEKFEAGLQDYAGIIGMGAAIRYLQQVGLEAIEKHEITLNQYLSEALKSVPGLQIIGPADARLRSGIVSFFIPGVDHHRIALMLDQMAGIAVRSGQHCVHSWFNSRGIPGSVRASVYFYNTVDEARALVDALIKIRKVL